MTGETHGQPINVREMPVAAMPTIASEASSNMILVLLASLAIMRISLAGISRGFFGWP